MQPIKTSCRNQHRPICMLYLYALHRRVKHTFGAMLKNMYSHTDITNVLRGSCSHTTAQFSKCISIHTHTSWVYRLNTTDIYWAVEFRWKSCVHAHANIPYIDIFMRTELSLCLHKHIDTFIFLCSCTKVRGIAAQHVTVRSFELRIWTLSPPCRHAHNDSNDNLA